MAQASSVSIKLLSITRTLYSSIGCVAAQNWKHQLCSVVCVSMLGRSLHAGSKCVEGHACETANAKNGGNLNSSSTARNSSSFCCRPWLAAS